MRFQMKVNILINASATKSWKTIAHDFGDISHWSSIIMHSSAINIDTSNNENKLSGRKCSAYGFVNTEQELTDFNEKKMHLSYKAKSGLPHFITSAENTWKVLAISDHESIVQTQAVINTGMISGILIAPLFKLFMGRKGDQMIEELKYYIEHDQPHPRKQKQLHKTALAA